MAGHPQPSLSGESAAAQLLARLCVPTPTSHIGAKSCEAFFPHCVRHLCSCLPPVAMSLNPRQPKTSHHRRQKAPAHPNLRRPGDPLHL